MGRVGGGEGERQCLFPVTDEGGGGSSGAAESIQKAAERKLLKGFGQTRSITRYCFIFFMQTDVQKLDFNRVKAVVKKPVGGPA